jgi:hypothetical protein
MVGPLVLKLRNLLKEERYFLKNLFHNFSNWFIKYVIVLIFNNVLLRESRITYSSYVKNFSSNFGHEFKKININITQ